MKKTFRASYAIIAVWIAMFFVGLFTDINELLCNKGVNGINGEYYRFFTGLLLHVNWLHLLQMQFQFILLNFIWTIK